MRSGIYNSCIPSDLWNTVNRTLFACLRRLAQFSILIFSLAFAHAADWHEPEEALAKKIAAVTGPGAIALTVDNRSSLSRRDAEIIQNGLRSEMEKIGLRYVQAEQAAGAVTISLSENVTSYVWVAQIHQAAGESAVVMVATPRSGGMVASHDSAPMILHKTQLWAQDAPMLDVAVLDETAVATHLAVLEPEKVSLYRLQTGKWQAEQTLPIVHAHPWPRDLRGRLVLGKDHLLDVYLPGVVCSSTPAAPVTLNCHEGDDPWPLGTAGVSLSAFFSPARNFFTGAINPPLGKFATVPKFYSAAAIPRDKYALWLFAATDGRIHEVDGVSDQTAVLGWGDIASVKTTCGSGWQVLAAAQDSVRAYEFPDRDPVAVSSAVDFSGTISALWAENKGDTAVAIARNSNTGSYEAFRLAVSCGQ